MEAESSHPTIIALDPLVRFDTREVGGRTTTLAHHKGLGKYFHLGAEEYHIASLLDGQRTLSEIIAQLEVDGVCWREKEVADFIGNLVSSRLAIVLGPAASTPVAGPRFWSARIPQALSLLVSQRIPLADANRIATRLLHPLGQVFSKAGMLYWLCLIASAMLIFTVYRRDFVDELRRMFDPKIWVVLLLMWVVCKLIHEIGHAVAARYHGVKVGKVGLLFFFCAPLAYVDVTDAWKLKSRWRRVQIALAGVYLELAVASIAVWAWWIFPEGYMQHLAAQLFFVAGPATLLVNANPLLRLDGYYVVSDVTEIPNLRMHGRSQLAGFVEQVVLGSPPRPSLLSGWRRTFATVHASASVVFQVVWMSGLVIGVAMWARGLGVVMATAAVLLWGILPLARWTAKVWRSEPAGHWYLNKPRTRLICSACLLAMAVHYASAFDSPLARRVPVVVQYREEQIARASADAFVRRVYVTRGQRISKGTLMIELDDPELLIDREEKADDLKIAELRAVQFRRQRDLAKSAAETENAESLRRQLLELDAQIEGLRVVANRDGLVTGLNIEALTGRFVEQGEELSSSV